MIRNLSLSLSLSSERFENWTSIDDFTELKYEIIKWTWRQKIAICVDNKRLVIRTWPRVALKKTLFVYRRQKL